jgi:hypothetical protein
MLLYTGPATSPDASHDAWPGWFRDAGDRLVDVGSPLIGGLAIRSDQSTTDPASRVNGYSIVEAEDVTEAIGLLGDHPYLAQGEPFTIEVHALR